MIRRVLSLFLAAALVLGGAGSFAASSCGATTAALSAASGGCGGCGGEDEGQTHQGCAVLTCAAACISGPALAADGRRGPDRVIAVEKTAPAPHDALRARAVAPDIPPPR